MIERTLRLCDDESAVLGKLAQAGYRPGDNDAYREAHFIVGEERWYAVDAAFPRLTGNDLAAAGIPVAVLDVAYTVDLSMEPPTPLERNRVSQHLDAMIREVT